MALKGARTIVVRDKTFKWNVGAGKYAKECGAPRRPHFVAQEDAERPGAVLYVYNVPAGA